MRRWRRLTVLLTLLSAMPGLGCAMLWPHALSDDEFPNFRKAETEACEPLLCPEKGQLERARTRVVLGDVLGAPDASIAKSIESSLEAILGATGVEVVARREARGLLEEVRLAEQKGHTDRYRGPVLADYAIVTGVDAIDVSAEFHQAAVVDGKKMGNDQCKYTASVSGMLRVYRIPALNVAASIPLSATAARFEPARTCRPVGNTPEFVPLAREAAEEAIDRSREHAQNFFSPEGFVVARRRWEEKDREIFWVSSGAKAGFASGDEVVVIRKVREVNPLAGTAEIHEETLGEGVVVRVAEGRAWIALNESAVSKRVISGDSVKVVYEKDFWDKVQDFSADVAAGN